MCGYKREENKKSQFNEASVVGWLSSRKELSYICELNIDRYM